MKNVKSVQLDECDLIKVEDTSTVVMVKVKEIDTISNVYHVCRNEGFNDIKIHHIEIGTWNIHISNDIESNDSDDEDISSNGNVDANEALHDFIQHVVEEKEVEKTPPKDPIVDDSKRLGFEKCHIYNNDDVTSRAQNEDVSFSTDQVKDNHIVPHKDMAVDEVVSDNSKPPSFENFIKENKACSRSSSTLRASKCSTSFANYSRKYLKGFSFIDEINQMIEVGGDLGYDAKGKCKKRVWIKELCFKHNVHILGVQETKMSKLEVFQLRSMWGNFKFDYTCSMARGRSGGLVTLWDPNAFAKKRIWYSDNYIIVEGKWKISVDDYYIINVYCLQHQPDKSNLWSYLRVFIQDYIGRVILFGDLNKVRSESERFGSTFSCGDATIFNSFIHDTSLIDLPMGARHFTWVNKVGSKMRKLDCFLISNDVLHSNTDLKEKWAAISHLEQSKPLHTKLKDLKSHLKLWYAHTKEVEFNIPKIQHAANTTWDATS
ncbi:RNA-directed DNA polymerase, eukaryota, reverse transcriptase zinc-binding domain protein [Tanacetum coccineum]